MCQSLFFNKVAGLRSATRRIQFITLIFIKKLFCFNLRKNVVVKLHVSRLGLHLSFSNLDVSEIISWIALLLKSSINFFSLSRQFYVIFGMNLITSVVSIVSCFKYFQPKCETENVTWCIGPSNIKQFLNTTTRFFCKKNFYKKMSLKSPKTLRKS